MFGILYKINNILMPTYDYHNSYWPGTSTFNEFYNMEKDSVDVLFLGPSVVTNAYCPQVIYDEYGIRSFNLSSEQQSIFLSYYWLKEALRSQSPQVVVLDSLFLEPIHQDDPVNMTEGMIRIGLDPMHLSKVKIEAVNDICRLDPSQQEISYYLTNIRFHGRWETLTAADFKNNGLDVAPLKGYYGITEMGPDSYEAYVPSASTERQEIPENMVIYFNKIVDLCNENGIKLVLVSLPGEPMYDSIHNSINDLAAENNVDYYNLTLQEYIDEIGAELPVESVIYHGNVWGSEKMSRFIGKILASNYNVDAVYDEQWEETRDFYNKYMQVRNLLLIKNISDYIDGILEAKESGIDIILASDGEIFSDEVKNSDKLKRNLTMLGVDAETIIDERELYTAYFHDGVWEEAYGTLKNDIESQIGIWKDRLTVEAYDDERQGVSLEIDAEEIIPEQTHFAIVIYDENTQRVIDISSLYLNDDNKLKLQHINTDES